MATLVFALLCYSSHNLENTCCFGSEEGGDGGSGLCFDQGYGRKGWRVEECAFGNAVLSGSLGVFVAVRQSAKRFRTGILRKWTHCC